MTRKNDSNQETIERVNRILQDYSITGRDRNDLLVERMEAEKRQAQIELDEDKRRENATGCFPMLLLLGLSSFGLLISLSQLV